MVAIPNQQFRQRDPGLPVNPPAIETYFYVGACSLGTVNEIHSFNDGADVVDVLGEGPLSEDVSRHLAIAGGPVYAMRLLGDVAATIGAVTKRPKSSSTGTVAVTVTPAPAAKVWQIDDPGGTPAYVDETDDFNDADTADVTPFPSSESEGDQFAIGFGSPFNSITLDLSTNGASGTIAVKYWDGSAWQAVTGLTDGTSALTTDGTITFTMPTDWVPHSINGSEELYYLAIEVATAFDTNPVISSGYIGGYGPHDAYDAKIRIRTTGTLGAAEFDYTLDGKNYTGFTVTVPAGGVYDIPNTGLRLTFTAGAGPINFEDGDLFEFTTTAPFFSATSLASGIDAIEADDNALFAALILSGRPASAAAAAALFSSLGTQLLALEQAHRPVGSMMDAGIDDTADAKSEFSVVSDRRILVTYGQGRLPSAKPFAGWSNPMRPGVTGVAPRAGNSLISTHLGRFADGAIEGLSEIEYNEEKGTAAMSAARFCTYRSWTGFPGGYYINRPNMMSPAGSDFVLWPHRMIMDTAHRTAHRSLQQFVNSKVRVLKDGTGRIDPKEAIRIEDIVNDALADLLLVPFDAEGNRGHVAAVRYIVDLEWDVANSNGVKGRLAAVRDGYAEEIITEIGFAAEAI